MLLETELELLLNNRVEKRKMDTNNTIFYYIFSVSYYLNTIILVEFQHFIRVYNIFSHIKQKIKKHLMIINKYLHIYKIYII